MTVLFSVIFSGLRGIDAPYEMYIAIILLVILTALLQAYLGKIPRWASAFAGVLTLVPWFIIAVLSEEEVKNHPGAVFCPLPFVIAFSALVGSS